MGLLRISTQGFSREVETSLIGPNKEAWPQLSYLYIDGEFVAAHLSVPGNDPSEPILEKLIPDEETADLVCGLGRICVTTSDFSRS